MTMGHIGLTPDDVLWNYPLALIGWMYALYLKSKGTKGIQRKGNTALALELLKQRIGENVDTDT